MRILLLNQCFYPDVVSTAQHLTDLAKGLAERGHDVTVITSDRGYDDPGTRFPRYEVWNNITIYRIPSLALGKSSKLRRALNFASFLAVCSLRLLTLRRFDVVVALTSPPLISFLATLFVALKGGRFVFWVMDLNPDEAIAAGWLRDNSLTAHVLKQLLNLSLKRSDRTIVLDRFMRDRVLAKGIEPERVSIVAPWSHDDDVGFSAMGREEFRRAHRIENKFVVMYSGNHSPCHPLDTLLEAARTMSANDDVVFYFVGGGSEQIKVKHFARVHQLNNIVCLPYQPLDKLSASLSAADLQVVVMGQEFAGIVHPCKIYNIMTVGAPALYIGPAASHVVDLANENQTNQILIANHGDVSAVVTLINKTNSASRSAGVLACRVELTVAPAASETPALPRERSWASANIPGHFSKQVLLPEMIELIESSNRAAGVLACRVEVPLTQTGRRGRLRS